jgi:uroporphyrin-3 C-methyltransferase
VSTEISGIESETPESPVEEQVAVKSAPENSRRKGGGGALAFFAFLFAAAALAGTGWLWWQNQAFTGQEEQRTLAEISRLENSDGKLSQELSQVRDQLSRLSADDSGAQFKSMQQQMQADRSKMGQVEQSLNEQISMARSLQAASESLHGRLLAAEAALAGMSTRELDAGGELDLAEVDYLLRLAVERLKLFSDPAAADRALEIADMNLAALDNPMYLGLRQEIASARRDLEAVNIPDYLEISALLDAVQQQIASLPFSDGGSVAESPGQAEGEGWWEKLKGVFSNLVTVRRSTDEESQRVTLQDKDYIRQRAWLQLEVAQLALMRRDQQAFRASLQRVKESLSKWFETGDSKYRAVMQNLDDLGRLEIQVQVPDITAPWSTLRMLRSGPPPRPPAAPKTEEQTAPTQPDGEDGTG